MRVKRRSLRILRRGLPSFSLRFHSRTTEKSSSRARVRYAVAEMNGVCVGMAHRPSAPRHRHDRPRLHAPRERDDRAAAAPRTVRPATASSHGSPTLRRSCRPEPSSRSEMTSTPRPDGRRPGVPFAPVRSTCALPGEAAIASACARRLCAERSALEVVVQTSRPRCRGRSPRPPRRRPRPRRRSRSCRAPRLRRGNGMTFERSARACSRMRPRSAAAAAAGGAAYASTAVTSCRLGELALAAAHSGACAPRTRAPRRRRARPARTRTSGRGLPRVSMFLPRCERRREARAAARARRTSCS